MGNNLMSCGLEASECGRLHRCDLCIHESIDGTCLSETTYCDFGVGRCSFCPNPLTLMDSINPQHYCRLKPEPIDVMLAWKLPHCLAAALKYIARAETHRAGPVENAKKAIRYLEFYIKSKEEMK